VTTWSLSRIRRIGTSRYSLFREQLGYLDGGSATLLQAMRASTWSPLASGAAVEAKIERCSPTPWSALILISSSQTG